MLYTLKKAVRPLLQDVKAYQFSYKPTIPLIFIYLNKLKYEGAHSCFSIIRDLQILNSDTADYCLAETYYYCGNYELSINILNNLKIKFPKKEEIYYLLHKCFLRLNERNKAINILIELLNISNRHKTWIYWANAVTTLDEFKQFERLFLDKYNLNKIEDISLINYYAEAALNASQYAAAANIWNNFKKNNISTIYFNESKFNDISILASIALNDLRLVLNNHDIKFFIISGTLLGCIRDGKILSHDKDIDIGIFENEINLDILLSCISKSGHFDIVPIKDSKYIKIKHLNGVFIDIFIHYSDDKYCYHRTTKIEWKNKKFELVEVDFLNNKYFIPKDYQVYLEENYGVDWRIPKINFDSNFDTPNAQIINSSAVEVFCEKVKTYQHYQLKYLN